MVGAGRGLEVEKNDFMAWRWPTKEKARTDVWTEKAFEKECHDYKGQRQPKRLPCYQPSDNNGLCLQ